jgi:hypothetical protein
VHRRVSPTCGFTASTEVGPRATVGTLQTGYLCIQASRQGKKQGVHPHATMCPTSLDPAFLLAWALVLPCVSRHRTPPPCWRGLQCCHVSYSSGSRFSAEAGFGAVMCPLAPDPASLLERAPALPCVLWLQTLPPRWNGSGVATHPTVPCGPHTTSIKKHLADMVKLLGPHVFKARAHVSKMTGIRSIMNM